MFQVTVLSAKIRFTLFFTPAYLKSSSTGWMSILENHKKRRELMCSCFPCSNLRESFSRQQTNLSCIKQSVRVCWYVFQLILCPSFAESAEHCLNNLAIHAVDFPTRESVRHHLLYKHSEFSEATCGHNYTYSTVLYDCLTGFCSINYVLTD